MTNDVTARYVFGEWLRKRREGENLSLRQLSDRIGFSHQTLSKAENGEYTHRVVKAIARYYGESEEKLLRMAGELPQETRDEIADEIRFVSGKLPPDEQQVVLKLIRNMVDESEQQRRIDNGRLRNGLTV